MTSNRRNRWRRRRLKLGVFLNLKKSLASLGDVKDCLHEIVTSQFDTSMEKKKLFKKAMRVHMQAMAKTNPRKSRRRNSKATSTEKSEHASHCC